MSRRYDAFLIRRWSLDGGLERAEITHLQSGTTVRGHTLTQTIDWMGAVLAAQDLNESPGTQVSSRGPPSERSGDESDHQ